MIKELILTTMFSFAPLINGVSPSKADVFFSSSESETSEEVVTLDDGKTYRKVYDAQSNDVNSNDDLIDGNAYRFNFFDFSGNNITFLDFGEFEFHFYQYGEISYKFKSDDSASMFHLDDIYYDIEQEDYLNGFLYSDGQSLFNLYIDLIIPFLSSDNICYYTYLISDSDNYSASQFDYAFTYLVFDRANYKDDNGDVIDLYDDFHYFFENAGDNLPFHYEEIVKGHTLFDIINDWYLSLFSNETLDSYKFNLFGKEVSMTQYLCNVATIITLVSLVIAVVSITVFIFKLSAGLFKW